MSLMEGVKHLKIPLEKIKLATKNFSDETYIAQGGFGKVYEGILTLSKQQIKVAVKRLDRDSQFGQGNREYLKEIQMLTCYKHKNLVSLVGFCDENGEGILVYEHAKHGSLDRHLRNTTELSWIQRLKISLGAARGLNYLHHEVGPNHRVIHRDIKSANILLDESWEAKVSDFGLSKIGPSNVEFTFLVTTACGTFGYIDPQYHKTGILTKESDVYSFGVVLFEILCGRQAHICEYQDERVFLATLAPQLCKENRLDEIIVTDLRNQMTEDSLNVFSKVAYRCLKKKRKDRPTMGQIVEQLEHALQLQLHFIHPLTTSLMEGVQHLKIPLENIKLATKNFSDETFIGQGGFGKVYEGIITLSEKQIRVAVKRLDRQFGQGNREFLTEIQMLTCYRHKNLVSLVGSCDENGEGILVYEHAKHGSLDRHLRNTTELSWIQRLKISLGAARGINYLHHEAGAEHRVLHRDIKSPNILLDENWEAKVSDFGLSKISRSNVEFTYVVTDDCVSWNQRLKISLGAPRGLNYLHHEAGTEHRVLHRDIKSLNILLDENLEAKVSDFGLSEISRSKVEFSYVVTAACGTYGYIDPQYLKTSIVTTESDVYSFGVVLFEILCGRQAHICDCEYQDERVFLATLAQQSFEQDTLDEIILPGLKDQMREDSLSVFSKVAYQCLKKNRKDRPTMGEIVETLEHAMQLQVCSYSATFIRVGTWGKQSAGPDNDPWSFELERNHKLQKITIDHGDVIYSLMFTTQCDGIFLTSNKAGGSAGGDIVSEVMLDADEEIIDIKGTTGTRGGNTVISSLNFVTNKRIHGFGRVSECEFSIPWEKGSLVGFYGLAGDFIDSIGVCLKADAEIMKVGPWGKNERDVSPESHWSFKLERNHQLKEITIDHSDLIHILIFTAQYKGVKYISKEVGGVGASRSGHISVVKFDWDEEIIGIAGTVALSRGSNPGWVIISSISFVTDKRTHGPFGTVRGAPFSTRWESGSFAGFYGLCGGYLDSIGAYLKATL